MAVPPSPVAPKQALQWVPAALPECKLERIQELKKMHTLGIQNVGNMTWDTVQALSCDPLTGLPMSRLFEARVAYLLEQSEHPFAIIIVNCEKFRLINELYGRNTANQVLRLLARRFEKLNQPSVFCARLRDDRFGFIVNKAHHVLAEDFIDHLQQVLAKPMRFRNHRYQLGFAMGIHWRNAGQDDNAHDLILDAETTLAHARAKCNQHLVAVSEYPSIKKSLSKPLAGTLAKQLNDGTLPIKISPVINLRTSNKYSYQAVPMLLDNGEEIPLSTTFSLAERHGLMLKLTDYVIAQAISQFHNLFQQRDLYLSVKVSRIDITNNKLLTKTRALLAQAEIPHHKFKFELHDEVQHHQWQQVIADIFELAQAHQPRQFKRAHANKRVDSQTLPMDKVIWIGAHLLNHALSDLHQLQMLKAVIDLARSQGIDVMASGVDRIEDKALALELGILYGTGDAFGQPASLVL